MATKLPSLPYVKRFPAKGKVYFYFDTGRRKANGRKVFVRLPDYDDPTFFAAYAALKGHRTRRQETLPTVASVAALYQKTDTWARLSPGTHKVYRVTLNKVLAEFGEFPLGDVTRKLVWQVLDEIPGPASRNLFVAVLGALFKFARQRDLTDAEPTKDIPKFQTGEHAPWPKALLAKALASEDATVRLAVHLLYFTGLRVGDVCALRWSDVQGDRIVVVPQKTRAQKKTLAIHMHRALREELARTPKLGMAILAKLNGTRLAPQTILARLKAFAADHGAGRVVTHGLRKNAVNALLEAGCTIPEVQAVTGQSVEMVMHYAAKVDQGVLSEAAILKLEGQGHRA